jgi:hypothetical protein
MMHLLHPMNPSGEVFTLSPVSETLFLATTKKDKGKCPKIRNSLITCPLDKTLTRLTGRNVPTPDNARHFAAIRGCSGQATVTLEFSEAQNCLLM